MSFTPDTPKFGGHEQSILRIAKDGYRTQLDDGKWPPALHAKDSNALNKNFGTVDASNLNELVNALVRFMGERETSQTMNVTRRHTPPRSSPSCAVSRKLRTEES